MAVFMWFSFFLSFFSHYQLLISQVMDSADGGWEGQENGSGKREGKREGPSSPIDAEKCSGGSDHCPLLTSWMSGGVWASPNLRTRLFIRQPPGGLQAGACLKGPSGSTCYLVLELSAKQPSPLDTAWCWPSEQDRSVALWDVTPNKLRCLSCCQ